MKNLVRLALPLVIFALAACGEAPDRAGDGEQPAVASPSPSEADEAAEAEEEDGYPLGTPRDDLDRFYGVYGSADQPNRDFFVAEAKSPPATERPIPPGYLMIGAMWGDVAPWYMRSTADAAFEQQWVSQYQSEPLVAAFEVDAEGQAVALTFETLFADRGRLERKGDLPDGW